MIATEQHQRVQEHFQRISAAWGQRYERPPQRMSDLDLLLRRQHAQRLLRQIADSRRDTTHLLDVGCGAGTLLSGMDQRSLVLHGIDLVPEMVYEARRRNPQGRFLVAEATRIPFAEASFDALTCLGVLEYVPAPQGVLREMHRVLKPGGHLIVSFPNRSSMFRTASRVEVALEQGFANSLRRLRGNAPHDGGGKARYAHRAASPAEARRLLAQHGFAVEDMIFHTYGLWGRVGWSNAALRFSRWLSQRYDQESPLATNLACTFLVLARRAAADEAQQAQLGRRFQRGGRA